MKPSLFADQSKQNYHCYLLLIFLGGLLFLNGWYGDDAYITFRTVQNFVNGFGLTYNLAERVQAYTHPLWTLLLIPLYALTREFYLTVLALELICALGAVHLLIKEHTTSKAWALLTVLILSCSKAFLDYSVCGLENPLSLLLISLFFRDYFRFEFEKSGESLFLRLSFWTALTMLSRMDLILLLLPCLIAAGRQLPLKKSFRLFLTGFLPFIIWEIFSLWYYGFLFPNTAYAKLNTGLSASTLIPIGLEYLLRAFQWDPVTFLTIAGGLGIALFGKNIKLKWIALGLGLYLIYLIKIGGDFMSTRLLAAPFLMALIIILKRLALSSTHVLGGDPRQNHSGMKDSTAAVVLAAAIWGLSSFWGSNPVHNYAPPTLYKHHVINEKWIYYPHTGVVPNFSKLLTPNFSYSTYPMTSLNYPTGKKMLGFVFCAGYRVFEAGPDAYMIDVNALTDPFLSKLPVRDKNYWRIGHFSRGVVDGYVQSLMSGTNLIKDPELREYYEKIRILTRGDLLSAPRFIEIIKMNLGMYNPLLNNAVQIPPPVALPKFWW